MSHDAVNNSGGVVESLLYITVSFRITKLRRKNAYNSFQTGSWETGPLTGYKTSA